MNIVYAVGWVVSMCLFVQKMTNAWWDAQGRDVPFEFGGALWVLIGSAFFAFLWPVSLPVCLVGLVFQKAVNEKASVNRRSVGHEGGQG